LPGVSPKRWPPCGGGGAPPKPTASHYYRGSQLVEHKSNEIPAVRQLLARVDVTGCLIGVDALHTQQDTARQIVLKPGAD